MKPLLQTQVQPQKPFGPPQRPRVQGGRPHLLTEPQRPQEMGKNGIKGLKDHINLLNIR